jgi:hypothetical protein
MPEEIQSPIKVTDVKNDEVRDIEITDLQNQMYTIVRKDDGLDPAKKIQAIEEYLPLVFSRDAETDIEKKIYLLLLQNTGLSINEKVKTLEEYSVELKAKMENYARPLRNRANADELSEPTSEAEINFSYELGTETLYFDRSGRYEITLPELNTESSGPVAEFHFKKFEDTDMLEFKMLTPYGYRIQVGSSGEITTMNDMEETYVFNEKSDPSRIQLLTKDSTAQLPWYEVKKVDGKWFVQKVNNETFPQEI